MNRISAWGRIGLYLALLSIASVASGQYGYGGGYGGNAYPPDASRTGYTPGDVGDWSSVPTLVSAALDSLAAVVGSVGTAASEDVGTAVGDVVQLEDVGGGTAGLPAVDGSQLTGVSVAASDDSIRTRSTGVFNGGVVSINGVDDATFDLSEGGASILDAWSDPENPVSRIVEWAAQTGLTVTNTGDRSISYVGLRIDNTAPPGGETQALAATIDGEAGTVYLTFSPDGYTSIERRDIASLGLLFHPAGTGGSIVTAEQLVNSNIGPIHSLLDLFDVIGSVQTEGGTISANGANLRLDVAAGRQFRPGTGWDDTESGRKNVNFTDTPSATAASFVYSYRDGSGGYASSASTQDLVPGSYDDGDGTLGTVSVNRWSIQNVYLFTSGALRVIYGQGTFGTQDDARAAIGTEVVDTDPGIVAGGVLIAQIILRGGASDLTDSGDALILPVSKFVSTSGGGGQSNTLAVDPSATGVDPTSAQSGVELRVKGLLGGEGVDATIDSDDVRFDLDINGLTAQASPDGAADYVAIYDDAAGAHRKVLLDNLGGGGGATNLGSYWFDGTDDFMEIVNASAPNLTLTGDFTIEAWIRVESTSGDRTIASKWEEAVGASKNYTFLHDGAQKLELRLWDSVGGFQVVYVSATTAIETDSWIHVAVAFDVSADTAYFYVNGVQIDAVTSAIDTIQSGTADFRIGAEDGGADFFDGNIDHVRVWGDLRTTAEINATMYSIIGAAGDNLISEWVLDGDATDPVSSYDLTITGPSDVSFVPFRL